MKLNWSGSSEGVSARCSLWGECRPSLSTRVAFGLGTATGAEAAGAPFDRMFLEAEKVFRSISCCSSRRLSSCSGSSMPKLAFLTASKSLWWRAKISLTFSRSLSVS